MGNNKSKNWWALTSHILVYTATLAVFISIWAGYNGFTFWTTLTFFLVNGTLHFVTDAITSRLSGYAWKNRMLSQKVEDMNHYEKMFWNVIGADQAIHALCLTVTAFAWFSVA